MLNIGPGELLAICVIALIVLGPEKLPQAIRTVGRVTGELRRMSSGFQSELQNALREDQPEPRRVTPQRPSQAQDTTTSEDPVVAQGATASDGRTASDDRSVSDDGAATEDPAPDGTADTIAADALDNFDRS